MLLSPSGSDYHKRTSNCQVINAIKRHFSSNTVVTTCFLVFTGHSAPTVMEVANNSETLKPPPRFKPPPALRPSPLRRGGAYCPLHHCRGSDVCRNGISSLFGVFLLAGIGWFFGFFRGFWRAGFNFISCFHVKTCGFYSVGTAHPTFILVPVLHYEPPL